MRQWGEPGSTWQRDLAETLRWLRASREDVRSTREFQERLWEHNHVAAVGQGTVSVERALDDADFRRWLASRSMEKLPDGSQERLAFLKSFYQDTQARLAPFLDDRVPHLKIFRVMAALYPEAMTTLASSGALHKLARAMGTNQRLDPVEGHVWVRDRIDRVLPRVANDPASLAERMSLPWILYERYVRPPSEVTEKAITGADETKLLPLPAARRRKGLTPLRGLFPGVLSTLEYVREGPTRSELLDFLRASAPEAKENSLGVTINALQSELSVVRAQGDRYVLTERGEDVLESQDPGHLADWILTRILGADRVLVELRDKGPQEPDAITAAIRSTNSGLKSDFVPHAMLGWFRSMNVIAKGPDGKYVLTNQGREWASRIHWQPESLVAEPTDGPDVLPDAEAAPTRVPPVVRPDVATILQRIEGEGRFPRSLVERLDAGLWSHDRRHFAVLTGLSGSGKTLLASAYGRAVAGPGCTAQVVTLPVQPGWYDPGPLLGFVNPLRGDSYVRTRFLDFLLTAGSDPKNPYVAIFDEMNLSHPEQYMAPLLSAMETGEPIPLHAEGEYFDGVPSTLPYPRNLVIIGTVNMDETTHGLSDKVLDRAFVLEFWDVDLAEYPRWGKRQLSPTLESRARDVLTDLMAALSPARLHFGWRVVDDVMSFLEQARRDGSGLSDDAALDAVVYAKILPKLRGDDAPRFRAALDACESALKKFGLEHSRTRVVDLRRDLETTGSARFWR
jgi:MoxR-like ATPase